MVKDYLTSLFRSCSGCLLIIVSSGISGAELALPLEVEVIGEGEPGIILVWPSADYSLTAPVEISRRQLGETGRTTWRVIQSVSRRARSFRDIEVEEGIAYEYRVTLTGENNISTGYAAVGIKVPASDKRGTVLLVVDKTIAPQIASRLHRFRMDLAGDGWEVKQLVADRGLQNNAEANMVAAREIRRWITETYAEDPQKDHALILLGHIPVVKSGRSAPDGHTSRPLETDLFYADVNGNWTAGSNGMLLHNSVPGSHIEMTVGRIDFSFLDVRFGSEVSLLRQYLDKNHHWRHGLIETSGMAYGGNSHLKVETAGLQNILGPRQLIEGSHHIEGVQQPWLFGVDFGDRNVSAYRAAQTIRTVFSLNFGSGKLDFSRRDNTMRTLLAEPWYPLVTGWGGRPSWQLHHMALGRTAGYSHMRTVNNGVYSQGKATLEYIPTGNYAWVNPVWVNLMGDPTLHAFPVRSVTGFTAVQHADETELSWNHTESLEGAAYHVYRATDALGPYQRLSPESGLTEPVFIDEEPPANAWYMVRISGVKNVYAGSFNHWSQGVYARAGDAPPVVRNDQYQISAGEQLLLEPSASDTDSEVAMISGFIHDDQTNALFRTEAGWLFAPHTEVSGLVTLPFTVYDGVYSSSGVIDVVISSSQ